MKNIPIVIVLALSPILVFSQDKVSDYISNYQQIAISEMDRSGIPASITLAQGMFESGYGLSPSAIGYNNHFGIKCKKEWTGPYFYKHDDDRDKNGKLIPSCFRAYGSAAQSFQDHTNFLVERERYAELFTYDRTDYYNWAMGLQRCGYATNKMYGKRLVQIIERYGLNQYDSPDYSRQSHVIANTITTEGQDAPSVATDAFSVITSDANNVEIDQSYSIAPTVSEVTAPVEVEDDTQVTQVLESFEAFSQENVYAVPATKTITEMSVQAAQYKPASVSRVNRAIILPANYKRKAEASRGTPAKMDRP